MKGKIISMGLVIVILIELVVILSPYRLGRILDTGSMEPELMGGDVVILKKYSGEILFVGDIIAFKSDRHSKLILHRIVDIDIDGYTTQGDNLATPDPGKKTMSDVIQIVCYRIPLSKITLLSYLSSKGKY